MSIHRKPLERRTYSQDRYYALIKRQKAGKATFKELTELDEIVNRVPDIRDIVIQENFMTEDEPGYNDPSDQNGKEGSLYRQQLHHRNLWNRLQSFLNRVFASQAPDIKTSGQLIIF